jgi:hypothetical protein
MRWSEFAESVAAMALLIVLGPTATLGQKGGQQGEAGWRAAEHRRYQALEHVRLQQLWYVHQVERMLQTESYGEPPAADEAAGGL